jgi:hypothetical protein
MLLLTAPRVHRLNALYYKKFELTPTILNKTKTIMAKSLRDGNFMTREELSIEFQKQKIKRDRLGLSYIIMHAELEGIICSGPRRGKQFTYALMDERALESKITKEEALQKLSQLYYASRGPASAADFSWWSGLTIKEVNEGIESLDASFQQLEHKDQRLIFQPNNLPRISARQSTFLVPDYDEYGIAYKDRTVYHHPGWVKPDYSPGQEYYHALSVDGYFGGRWEKTMNKTQPFAKAFPFPGLSDAQLKRVARAEMHYNRFFGKM